MSRILLALALCTGLLAGCADPDPTVPTLTALEAYEQATEARPGLQMQSLRGMEGWRPGPRSDYLGLTDDGLPDGPLGDGRLSSWAVSFLVEDGLLELQVFADGREPKVRYHEIPSISLDGLVFLERPLDIVDSDVAAEQAALEPAFIEHVAANPGAGFLYTKARQEFGHPPGADQGGGGGDEPSTLKANGDAPAVDEEDEAVGMAFLGWPPITGSWSIVHFPADGVDPLALASVAADGTSLGMRLARPTHSAAVADERLYLAEPFPPPVDPIVHRLNFTVPRGATNLTGDVGVPSFFEGEWHLRIVQPGGTVFFDSGGSKAFARLDLQEPAPGNWTVEATHTVPVPEVPSGVVPFDLSPYLHVELVADLPILAGT